MSVPNDLSDATFPPALLPTIYADGVLNLAHTPMLVKFYLVRNDPSQTADDYEKFKTQTVAQVVMSMRGFAEMALFFEEALKEFIKDNQSLAGLVTRLRQQQAAEK
jgi:hypothetical protein